MTNKQIHKISNYLVAAVWIANGLFCKVLHFVPRHEQIVQRILSVDLMTANIFTILIGLSEIGMAIWILSGLWKRQNAITQILVVATMNILEFVLVPDLLLWGRINAFFAFIFVLFVYFNEFYLNKNA